MIFASQTHKLIRIFRSSGSLRLPATLHGIIVLLDRDRASTTVILDAIDDIGE